MIVERINTLKQNKIGHLKIKNYKFERAENFEYLGVILHEDNHHQIHLQERIKNANKTYFMLQNFFENKNIFKETKTDTEEHNNRQNVNICNINRDTNKKKWKATEHF
jgi:hypothetical protein